MLKKEDMPVLNQLIASLEESMYHLEDAYEKKDSENFNKLKKSMTQIQGKISGMIK